MPASRRRESQAREDLLPGIRNWPHQLQAWQAWPLASMKWRGRKQHKRAEGCIGLGLEGAGLWATWPEKTAAHAAAPIAPLKAGRQKAGAPTTGKNLPQRSHTVKISRVRCSASAGTANTCAMSAAMVPDSVMRAGAQASGCFSRQQALSLAVVCRCCGRYHSLRQRINRMTPHDTHARTRADNE